MAPLIADSFLEMDDLVSLRKRLRIACDDEEDSSQLISVLDECARELARDKDSRTRMGQEELDIWADLHMLWKRTVAAHGITEEDAIASADQRQRRINEARDLCTSVARLTRNLVAGVRKNQLKAYENEPEIRWLIKHYTSWSLLSDERALSVTRILTQTLSNLVTSNDTLLSRLWTEYLSLPEEQLILIRLLSSTDARIVLPTMVLILNCLHGSQERIEKLCTTPMGARICVLTLDTIVLLHDAEEGSEGAKAFDLGYEIFVRVFDAGLTSRAYKNLIVKDEPITPPQTTLLKLLDSYLQAAALQDAQSQDKNHGDLPSMLTMAFFQLSIYAQTAILKSLGEPNLAAARASHASSRSRSPGESPTTPRPGGHDSPKRSPPSPSLDTTPLHELDLILPKVCEALVLITQCIISLALRDLDEQEKRRKASDHVPSEEGLEEVGLQKMLNGVKDEKGRGLIESLVELLGLLDEFLPRINFGKPVGRQGPSASDVKAFQVSQASNADEGNPQDQGTTDPSGFSYLKRDLVRLLGILVYDSPTAQDRVRDCQGISIVMNMCVVDERNPYLREHAILTLRNLLHENPTNQALVNDIKPTRGFGDDGVLRELGGP